MRVHTHTRAHSRSVVLAVVLVDVHQQHALAAVQGVVAERALAALDGAFHHMGAPFALT